MCSIVIMTAVVILHESKMVPITSNLPSGQSQVLLSATEEGNNLD